MSYITYYTLTHYQSIFTKNCVRRDVGLDVAGPDEPEGEVRGGGGGEVEVVIFCQGETVSPHTAVTWTQHHVTKDVCIIE